MGYSTHAAQNEKRIVAKWEGDNPFAPDLVGTDRQVEWARSLRAQKIGQYQALNPFIARAEWDAPLDTRFGIDWRFALYGERSYHELSGKNLPTRLTVVRWSWAPLLDFLEQQVSAKWWIENAAKGSQLEHRLPQPAVGTDGVLRTTLFSPDGTLTWIGIQSDLNRWAKESSQISNFLSHLNHKLIEGRNYAGRAWEDYPDNDPAGSYTITYHWARATKKKPPVYAVFKPLSGVEALPALGSAHVNGTPQDIDDCLEPVETPTPALSEAVVESVELEETNPVELAPTPTEAAVEPVELERVEEPPTPTPAPLDPLAVLDVIFVESSKLGLMLLSDEQQEACRVGLRAYLSGATLEPIEPIEPIEPATPKRSRGRPACDIDRDRVVEMIGAGVLGLEIARQLGVGSATLRRRLREWGLELPRR